MSTLRDGSPVSYVGSGRTGRTIGEHGQILAITGRGGHVKWASGDITLEDLHDVAPLGSSQVTATVEHDPLADSLDVGPIQLTGVRGAYDSEGSAGVVRMLAAQGRLAGLNSVMSSAREMVETRIRQEPTLRAAVASLDPEEADQVFVLASYTLLKEAFGGDDGCPAV